MLYPELLRRYLHLTNFALNLVVEAQVYPRHVPKWESHPGVICSRATFAPMR